MRTKTNEKKSGRGLSDSGYFREQPLAQKPCRLEPTAELLNAVPYTQRVFKASTSLLLLDLSPLPGSNPNRKQKMNFAPYQSSPPESERAKSPPLRSPTASPKPQQNRPARNLNSIADRDDPWAAARAQRLPSPSQYSDLENGPQPTAAPNNRGYTYGGGSTEIFETSLGFPLRIEACLAYLLLPPAGGVVLLIFEHKSDYVRFHAWQSALLFSMMFLIHIIFSWTAVISWMLFAVDLLLILWLTWGAWVNADTLDRIEVPVLGRLASGFVDDE